MTLDEELAELSRHVNYRYIPCFKQFGACAGEPVRCTLDAMHSDDVKHYNHEAQVSWW